MKEKKEPIYDPYKKTYTGTDILKGVFATILGAASYIFGFSYVSTALITLYFLLFPSVNFLSDKVVFSEASALIDSPIVWVLYYIGGVVIAHLMGLWGINRAPKLFKYTTIILGIILILYYLINLILHLIYAGNFVYCFFGIASGIVFIIQGALDKFSKA